MKTLKCLMKGLSLVMVGLSIVSCTGYYSGDGATSPAPMSPASENDVSYRAKELSRPGLGTGWGEEVESSIHYTTFKRSDGKPAGVEMIYYNDQEGVNAMTGGRAIEMGGMQPAAGGLVSWGVKSGRGFAKNISSNGRRYLVGRKNATYTLVVRNTCASAVEVVLSVDGLDVMDGKPASVKKRGYIVEPGKTLEIEGFRTSESAVAAFRFSSVFGSYANLRHGNTRNVGVIGMAVYTEKGVNPWKWGRGEIKQRAGARAFAEAPIMGVRS